jgi:hypothetical protein
MSRLATVLITAIVATIFITVFVTAFMRGTSLERDQQRVLSYALSPSLVDPGKAQGSVEIARRYMAEVAHEPVERYFFVYRGPYDSHLYRVNAIFDEDLKPPFTSSGSRSHKTRLILVDWIKQTVEKTLWPQ